MNIAESQFEIGRREVYKQDFHRAGTFRSDSSEYSRRSKKFDFVDSVETTENKEGFVFRIPLSKISIENLKIIHEKNYIIVQSNKKTIFINLDHRIRLGKLITTINEEMLIIEVKK